MTEDIQKLFSNVFDALRKYRLRDSGYVDDKSKLSENEKKVDDGCGMVINAFNDKIFLLYHAKRHFEDEDENQR